MTIGIRDVAERAGVSTATVSNVINKPGRTAASTAARVMAAMEELGYVPNQLARELRTGAPTSIGMVLLSVANPFFADLAHACEAAAEAAGYSLTISSSNESGDRQDRYVELFGRQRVAGVIVAPVDGPTAAMEALYRRGTPVVLFDEAGPHTRLPSVILDGRVGGYLAVRHLIETGRRRLVFLGGPLRLVEQRWIGAMQAAAEAASVSLRHIDTVGTTIEAGRAAGQAIEAMDPDDRPDAVFAANDLLALGLQQALITSSRIRLPQDLAIVGYDDIAFGATASVPLTTIRQPVDELAREAVRVLTREDADETPERVRIEPTLVVRQSTPAVAG
jgi:LacI family transcriptional regulator